MAGPAFYLGLFLHWAMFMSAFGVVQSPHRQIWGHLHMRHLFAISYFAVLMFWCIFVGTD